MHVDLVSPLPLEWVPKLWGWAQETPAANFDDTGPTNLGDFERELRQRPTLMTWGVLLNQLPSGAVGYQPITSRLGMFNGICFSKSAHGTGGPQLAVRMILDHLWSIGVEKVSASYFADNARVRRFLQKLGAVDEGFMRAHTLRAGQPVDMHLVAIFRPE